MKIYRKKNSHLTNEITDELNHELFEYRLEYIQLLNRN